MCLAPITIKKDYRTLDDTKQRNGTGLAVQVPCGKCPECLGARRNQWSFRLYHEMQVSESACFMTLTYEDPPLSFNGIYTLKHKDVQDFLKRLRKLNGRSAKPLKYYMVGEYGTNNYRPHYHLILFNLQKKYQERSLYIAEKVWKHGSIDIAMCNIATINYTTGYIMKGAWSPQTDDDDRTPEYAAMSKKLGMSYLTPQMWQYHLDRMDSSCNHPSGYRIALPRYYRDQIFSHDEKKELAEINKQIQSVKWQDFANIDFSNIIERTEDAFRKAEKKQKLQRLKL